MGLIVGDKVSLSFIVFGWTLPRTRLALRKHAASACVRRPGRCLQWRVHGSFGLNGCAGQATDAYAKALAEANELFGMYESDVPWPWFVRGVVHLQHRRVEQAVADLERSLGMGFRGSEVRIFAAAAQFRAGKVTEAAANYIEVMRNELACLGNPYAEPAELRQLIGPYIPLWKPPGKLFQRAICFYCAGKFEDARRVLDAVAIVGRDYVYAGNADAGDVLTWEYVLWRIAASRRHENVTPTMMAAEIEILPQEGAPALLVDLYREHGESCRDELERRYLPRCSLSDRIRFQFYLGLYFEHRGNSAEQREAASRFVQVVQQVPNEATLDSLDDSAAFLLDVARVMQQQQQQQQGREGGSS
ncbi:hypothetical protein CCYA_CCYA10G2765 [Cyanidiococcus yangmingshanensis]|nr:hypothetical protein CCYA_CCYA10G2765 [Cyanidiococcus yangmingshanensis]